MGFNEFSFAKIVVAIVTLMVYDYFAQKMNVFAEMDKLKPVCRWLIYIAIVCFIIVLKLHNGTNQNFIYFQF